MEERAKLAVDDLERAGGFDRANLLVATTTGSGWLAPWAVDSFEYLTGGDSAIVGMQYSYLPSWLSFLVDQKRAREAGRELFDAVYDRWSRLPTRERPRLFVFGLSLGSFGGETAFSGEYDLRNRTARALFARPPNFNLLYREFTDHRDPGSREVEPIFRVAARCASPTTSPPGSPAEWEDAGAVPAAPLGPDRGGAPAWPGTAPTGWRSRPAATCWTRCSGSRS